MRKVEREYRVSHERLGERQILRCFFEGCNVPLIERQLGLFIGLSPMISKLVSQVGSRALPKQEKVDYGPLLLPTNWQETTELQKLEVICGKKGIVFINVSFDDNEWLKG